MRKKMDDVAIAIAQAAVADAYNNPKTSPWPPSMEERIEAEEAEAKKQSCIDKRDL